MPRKPGAIFACCCQCRGLCAGAEGGWPGLAVVGQPVGPLRRKAARRPHQQWCVDRRARRQHAGVAEAVLVTRLAPPQRGEALVGGYRDVHQLLVGHQRAAVAVGAHADDLEGLALPAFHVGAQLGHLVAAHRAFGGPEHQQHDLVAQPGQIEGLAVERKLFGELVTGSREVTPLVEGRMPGVARIIAVPGPDEAGEMALLGMLLKS